MEQNMEDMMENIQLNEEANEQPMEQLPQQDVEMERNVDGGNEIVAENEGQGAADDPVIDEEDSLYECFYGQRFDPMLLVSFAYKWTIAGINEMLNQEPFELESVVFPLRDRHFSARAKLTLSASGVVHCSVCFLNTRQRQLQPNELVIPQLTCVLICPHDRRHLTRTRNYLYDTFLEYDNYFFNLPLVHRSSLVSPVYCVNKRVTIVLLLEPPRVMFRLGTTNGRFTQFIRHISNRMQLARCRYLEQFSSVYFSADVQGHRFQLQLWLDGYGYPRQSYLVVQVFFLAGSFDRQLREILRYEMYIRVVNQWGLNPDIERTVFLDRRYRRIFIINLGMSEFLQTDGFILNDSLQYQIQLRPAPIE